MILNKTDLQAITQELEQKVKGLKVVELTAIGSQPPTLSCISTSNEIVNFDKIFVTIQSINMINRKIMFYVNANEFEYYQNKIVKQRGY